MLILFLERLAETAWGKTVQDGEKRERKKVHFIVLCSAHFVAMTTSGCMCACLSVCLSHDLFVCLSVCHVCQCVCWFHSSVSAFDPPIPTHSKLELFASRGVNLTLLSGVIFWNYLNSK